MATVAAGHRSAPAGSQSREIDRERAKVTHMSPYCIITKQTHSTEYMALNGY